METTHERAADFGASGQKLKEDAVGAAGHLKNAAADEVRNLIADVEDLIARLADLNDSDVATLRDKVRSTVESAKESLADGTATLRRRAREAAGSADDYVHESPWAAVGLAALVGAVVGILVARRS
jgi:ElaB/YqjD/DUF883 family membrane-anchored ribosome-binding protein